MNEITRVGADLAKRVIQVHAVDASGKPVTNRALPRDKFVIWCAQLPAGCLVAMEASSSAHHWARKLVALGLDARIIAAHLVAPYRLQGKGGKNDANDAAAICEAASRPQMHFVPIKAVEQQSMLCVHRLREGFKTDRTACVNRIRGLLAEFGLVFGKTQFQRRQARNTQSGTVLRWHPQWYAMESSACSSFPGKKREFTSMSSTPTVKQNSGSRRRLHSQPTLGFRSANYAKHSP